MATIKKYNGSTWENTTARKYETKSEIIVPPTTIYSDGTAITAYNIKGNEEHTGTPSPSNPVEVNGVGERTENLWNEDYTGIMQDIITYLPLNVGDGDYTLSSTVTRSGEVAVLFLLAGNVSSGATTANNGVWNGQSRTVTAVNGYVTIGYRKYTTANPENANTMLNSGSTAKPYELNGYKIPISNGGVTTNIYLGSTQTVRQIKKLVLTGNESGWTMGTSNVGKRFGYRVLDAVESNTSKVNSILSHLPLTVSGGTNSYPNTYAIGSDLTLLIVLDSTYTSLNQFLDWLRGQYNNGTPVTLWYRTATPGTAAVNEPLMKIGNYADTLSNAAQIPTTEGANSITVDTTVQPSEFTATWTGWHNASVKEKSANYLDENDFGLVEVAAGVYCTGTDAGVLPSGTYTLSANKSSSAVQIYRTTKNGSTYNYETISELPYTFTADGVSNQIFRTAGSTETSWADAGYSKVMLNAGETAQTYEPYWK